MQKSANITPELQLDNEKYYQGCVEPKTSSGSTLPEIFPRALAAYFNSSAPMTMSWDGSSVS